MDTITSNKPHLLYNKAIIPDLAVNRSRPFKNQVFESEYSSALGKRNDDIQDKFFKEIKINSGHIKPKTDNSIFANGTNKATINMQGFTGKFFSFIILLFYYFK
jgi:hypothetical protein